jgi:LCP family protein required for cell wall assembly
MPAEDDVRAVDESRGAYVVDTRSPFRRRSKGRGPLPPLKPAGTYAKKDGGPPPLSQPEPATSAPAPRRPRRTGRNVIIVVLVVVLLWLAFVVWVPLNAWGNVSRVDNNPSGDRPVDNGGSNYLLVGSDSREGLTPEQQNSLNGGGPAEGKRTDSIILVHVPGNGGKAAMISIPRDSYVPIPGHGSNKINAAFAFGGAKLLTQTVEQVTGVHVDGYLEIGFAGFASVVDSLGGVDVCVPFDMKDQDAAIDLKQGCQTLDGPTALGFVRARKSDPRGDIGRAERQRQFLGALLKKAAAPATVLIPWRYKAFADAAASGLEVGETTSFGDAVAMLRALRGVDGGDTLSLVVPVESASLQTPNAGVAVKWNTAQAKALFSAIQQDQPLTLPPAGTVPG